MLPLSFATVMALLMTCISLILHAVNPKMKKIVFYELMQILVTVRFSCFGGWMIESSSKNEISSKIILLGAEAQDLINIHNISIDGERMVESFRLWISGGGNVIYVYGIN